MPLAAGTRLGPYEIVAPLGAGGMGEVYRARDPRLARDVAIKALPDGFARDPERLARFEREAKLLASLSHPNVAGIHGIEEVGGHRYLVLEFVDGETLAARLRRGPLPLDEALDVCRQIAAGVEAAHEAGIVHRDLKPGNVMLTASGTVKVLDFGLAKSGGGGTVSSPDVNLSASPTITYDATVAGVILGTAPYMSPEQARGRAVDRRSDIWSFGCVLYECLTGRQAFEGDTVSDTIAAILKTEPDLGALPADTPARVRELLERCLCKDPRERLRDIGEARVVLGAVHADDRVVTPAGATPPGRGIAPWLAIAGALALAALAVVTTLLVRPRPVPAPLRKLDLVADDVGVEWFVAPELSPDGGKIAYIARGQVWVRDLGQLEPHAIADVEGMTAFCWSPDSRELAFNDKKKIWKVAISGGAPIALCDVPGTGNTVGVAWSARGSIAFSAWRGSMYTVPAAGGTPSLLIDIDPRKIVDLHAPFWLANGDLMYIVHWNGRGDSTSGPRHDLEVFGDGRRTPIAARLGNEAQVKVTRSGELLYVLRDPNAGIWRIGYDARARRTIGEPHLVAAGGVSVSASNEGSLLYMEEGETRAPLEMIWVDRSGKVLGSTGAAYPNLSDAALSPDGRRVAFGIRQGEQEDIWVRDLVRGIDTRITFSDARESTPKWLAPNRLAYDEFDPVDHMHARILSVNADGSGGARVLAPVVGSSDQQAMLAPDGTSALRVIDDRGQGRMRLSTLLPDGSLGPPAPFLRFAPEPDVKSAALSPDGRLVAYSTNDEQPEVFLTRFPAGEGQWQVSTEGGRQPRWAAASRSLYYVAGTGSTHRWLVEVPIDPTQEPPIGRPARLFEFDPAWSRQPSDQSFDVSPDGQRFLITREAPGTAGHTARMVLVENWESESAKH